MTQEVGSGVNPRARVLTLGFGALGTLYSYLLSKGGAHLTCIARSNYEPLRKAGGLAVRSAKFGHAKERWMPNVLLQEGEEGAKKAREDQQQHGPYDFVLVTTKLVLERPTADALAPYLLPKSSLDQSARLPTVVMVQNGIDIEDATYQKLVAAQDPTASGILSAVAWIGANLRENGTAVEHGALERLEIGSYLPSSAVVDSSSASSASSLDRFCALWAAGGGHAVPHSDIQMLRWSKVMWNAAWGGMCCLARRPVDEILAPENVAYTLPVVRRTMLEILAVARGAGFDEQRLPASTVDQAIAITYSGKPTAGSAGSSTNVARGFKPSILLDLEAGRPMEVQAIVGNIIRLARRHDVDTPRLDMIFAALRPAQTQALSPSDTEATQNSSSDAVALDRECLPAGWPVGLQ